MSTSGSSKARPSFIFGVTGIFYLFGVVCLSGAIFNMGAGGIHSPDLLPGRYAHAVSMAATVNGALFLACAYGIHRRMLFAWWLGFAVLVIGQTYSAIDLLVRRDLGDIHALAMVFCLGSVAIASVLGRWWYTKRVHFS